MPDLKWSYEPVTAVPHVKPQCHKHNSKYYTMKNHMYKSTLTRLCNLHSGSACRRHLPGVIRILQNNNYDAYFNIDAILQIKLFPKFVPINNIGESRH